MSSRASNLSLLHPVALLNQHGGDPLVVVERQFHLPQVDVADRELVVWPAAWGDSATMRRPLAVAAAKTTRIRSVPFHELTWLPADRAHAANERIVCYLPAQSANFDKSC